MIYASSPGRRCVLLWIGHVIAGVRRPRGLLHLGPPITVHAGDANMNLSCSRGNVQVRLVATILDWQ